MLEGKIIIDTKSGTFTFSSTLFDILKPFREKALIVVVPSALDLGLEQAVEESLHRLAQLRVRQGLVEHHRDADRVGLDRGTLPQVLQAHAYRRIGTWKRYCLWRS